jgi:hypothetical protein
MSPFSERPTPLGFPARAGHLDCLHGNLPAVEIVAIFLAKGSDDRGGRVK